MDLKTVSVFVIGLLVAGGASGLVMMGYQARIDQLESQVGQLQTENEALQASYDQKAAEYSNLNSMYVSVSAQRDWLQSDLDTKEGYLKEVSSDISELNDTLRGYSQTEDAFRRVLCSEELDKIGPTVTELTDPSKDTWYNYQRLWDHVDDNIGYVYDIEFPIITTYRYITVDGVTCFTEFDVANYTNYIQTPEFTLTNKQGDCDDHAILLYGMMRYYLRHIHGTVYNIYLAFISYTDGEAHMAVFIPVQGGTMCILDPAGNYATERYGSLTSKTPSTELQSYAHHWAEEHVIESIKLYWVDDLDGSFSLEFEGGLEDTIKFFETS